MKKIRKILLFSFTCMLIIIGIVGCSLTEASSGSETPAAAF